MTYIFFFVSLNNSRENFIKNTIIKIKEQEEEELLKKGDNRHNER